MWWPIRNQILVPFTAVLLVAVMLTAVTAAIDAARRSERATASQLNQVIETLGQSNFPYSANVLEKMRGLSGAEFVVFDEPGRAVLSTLSDELTESLDAKSLPGNDQRFDLVSAPVMVVGDDRFFASTVRRRPSGSDATTLLVLYPEHTWRQARSEAIVLPLFVGGMTLLVTAGVSGWLAHRFSRRIHRVQEQVAAIAAGDFQEIPAEPRHDEIQVLAASVNRMSRQLREQQETIRRTERTRLLGQLASGLAHQLRNAVTGARMAVQIHRRRAGGTPDDSLDVALRQLSLMEEQVKGLLSLGRPERRAPVERTARDIVADTAALVRAACQHSDVIWACDLEATPQSPFADAEPIRTALVNLVLNAIEAAGPGGEVELAVSESDGRVAFDVIDNGTGPPPELGDSMFDLFVTDKPEGVGIGLAMAKQVADDRGGSLRWERVANRTHFRLTIPVAAEPAAAAK